VRAGRTREARDVAEEAGLDDEGAAARAVARSEDRHYEVEVNKRGFNAALLTKTLNDRWDNGWRLAHVIEQRGNTVLVFEERD
jgi:hypothetical protein